MEIKQGVYIVTGGASGLGFASAEMLTGAGATVVLADINPEAGALAARKLGNNARFSATDVTSETSVANTIALASAMGNLVGLINCAGIAPSARVLGKSALHSLELFAKTIDINLIGTFNTIRLAAQAMSANPADANAERGVIINTASIAAYDGQIGQAAYAASKGGITAMTLPLARELARQGIRVMTIAPGIMETPMMAGMAPDVAAALGSTVPFPPRLGLASEFAALAGHILANPYLNGEVIRLDGALRMAAR